jgi:hypothetical protein
MLQKHTLSQLGLFIGDYELSEKTRGHIPEQTMREVTAPYD